jgi:predicted PurR-regulated permease PerM
VYLLNGKEVLLPQCRKLLFGILRYDHADAVLKECAYADQMFSGFVYGKIVDSLLIGMIYFIVGTVLNIPYVAMISVIVGVTNVIPFFGPYIGAIPSAVILLLTNPLACLKFVIAIVIIQQFDGNFLGPKILGNTTGLSSYWVLFSILLFGGLFGFAGMLVGVPLFAVIYHIVKSRVEYLLKKKGLPVESSAYAAPPKERQKETRFFETWKKREGEKHESDQ